MENNVAMICPICEYQNAKITDNTDGADRSVILCQNCGKFEISGSALATLSNRDKDFELSYSIRRRYLRNERVYLNTTNRGEIMGGIEIPKRIKDIAESILKDVYTHDDMLSHGLSITNDNIASYAIEDTNRLQPILQYLEDIGWFKLMRFGGGGALLTITGTGIEYAESIVNPNFKSKQVFVAMSFNHELDVIYHEAITKAVEQCGLTPIRIDLVDFNDEIISNVLSRISQSRFLIADYTDNRPGVYFETGYAIGKGLPVIYCCRESDKGHIHFDVNHYKFIHWIEVGDFKTELVKRITNTGLNS